MKINKEYKEKVNYLFDILSKNGIDEVQVSFYGSGDDGNMELSETYPDKKEFSWDEPTIFSIGKINYTLYDLVINISDYILEMKCIDYANGDGNRGSIYYNIKERKVDMEYLVTHDEEYSFNIK
jgi:hypothetical protein